MPCGVVLVSDATGRELSIRLPTALGQASLKSLNPAEAKFLSRDQFRLDRGPERGGWIVQSDPYATNPLYINGGAIPPDGAVLKSGDVLSIKDKYFRLSVRLLP